MKNKLSTITGIVLIGWAIYLNIPFAILGAIFEYPNILRRPAAEVLTQFQAGGIRLLAAWYAFALVALLFPFAALLLHRVRGEENETLWRLATASGILAGALQLLGLIRWVFVVPQLARVFSDPTSSQASKDAKEGRRDGETERKLPRDLSLLSLLLSVPPSLRPSISPSLLLSVPPSSFVRFVSW